MIARPLAWASKWATMHFLREECPWKGDLKTKALILRGLDGGQAELLAGSWLEGSGSLAKQEPISPSWSHQRVDPLHGGSVGSCSAGHASPGMQLSRGPAQSPEMPTLKGLGGEAASHVGGRQEHVETRGQGNKGCGGWSRVSCAERSTNSQADACRTPWHGDHRGSGGSQPGGSSEGRSQEVPLAVGHGLWREESRPNKGPLAS